MILVATWLWQGIALALAVAAALSLSRGLAAATRHAIWWAALAAVVLLPLASLASRVAVSGPVVAPSAPAQAIAPVLLPAVPDAALLGFAVVWPMVVLMALLRIAFSVRAVRRLKWRSIPLGHSRASRLPMWSALAATRRIPELRVSREVRSASALGLGRPVILLSPGVLALDDDSLDAVVMHEFAHLARFDDWTQLGQAIVSAVFAAHPAVWYIGRRIRIEREAACDDFVLARGAAARRYARSLVELADPTGRQPWGAVAIPGATRSRSELRERIHRLLDPSRPRDAKLGGRAFSTCALAMAVAVGVSARTPAFVAFVESHVPAPPVAALSRATAAATRTVTVDSREDAAATRIARTAVVARKPIGGRSSAPEPVVTQAPGSTPPIGGPLVPLSASRRAVPADLAPVQRAVPAPPPAASAGAPPGAGEPWVNAARTVSDAAQATGTGAKSAGTSIGRFFGRAGKAIAGRF